MRRRLAIASPSRAVLSPSRRHSRWTRLSLICQPASLKKTTIDGRHIGQTGASVRSYQRPDALCQRARAGIGVVWIDADPERDKPVVQKP